MRFMSQRLTVPLFIEPLVDSFFITTVFITVVLNERVCLISMDVTNRGWRS